LVFSIAKEPIGASKYHHCAHSIRALDPFYDLNAAHAACFLYGPRFFGAFAACMTAQRLVVIARLVRAIQFSQRVGSKWIARMKADDDVGAEQYTSQQPGDDDKTVIESEPL
jgi:hypothetical protein